MLQPELQHSSLKSTLRKKKPIGVEEAFPEERKNKGSCIIFYSATIRITGNQVPSDIYICTINVIRSTRCMIRYDLMYDIIS